MDRSTHVSRRSFVRGAGLAGAAVLGVPTLLRAQAREIKVGHVARVAQLPFHHRDPFDRLLIAQALEEELAIVSRDPVFKSYGVRRIW